MPAGASGAAPPGATMESLLLSGWTMTATNCPGDTCNTPLMRNRQGRMYCTQCGTTYVTPDDAAAAGLSASAPGASGPGTASSGAGSAGASASAASATTSADPATVPNDVLDYDDDDDGWTPPTMEELAAIEAHRQRRDAASAKIAAKLLQGWKMLADLCPSPGCSSPLMQDARSGDIMCIACDRPLVRSGGDAGPFAFADGGSRSGSGGRAAAGAGASAGASAGAGAGAGSSDDDDGDEFGMAVSADDITARLAQAASRPTRRAAPDSGATSTGAAAGFPSGPPLSRRRLDHPGSSSTTVTAASAATDPGLAPVSRTRIMRPPANWDTMTPEELAEFAQAQAPARAAAGAAIASGAGSGVGGAATASAGAGSAGAAAAAAAPRRSMASTGVSTSASSARGSTTTVGLSTASGGIGDLGGGRGVQTTPSRPAPLLAGVGGHAPVDQAAYAAVTSTALATLYGKLDSATMQLQSTTNVPEVRELAHLMSDLSDAIGKLTELTAMTSGSGGGGSGGGMVRRSYFASSANTSPQ